MMANILNSSILNSIKLHSAILHKTLTQTSSIWLKLIHSDSTWWYQPSWIHPCWIQTLPSWIQTPCYLLSDSLKKDSHSIPTVTQAYSIWLTGWWQPSWILPSWLLPSRIQPCCKKLWLQLVQSDSNSFILTQLDDGSHLEFCHVGFRHCHLGFRHLVIFSQIHSKRLSLHSNSDSSLFNLTKLDDGNHLEFCHLGFSHFA